MRANEFGQWRVGHDCLKGSCPGASMGSRIDRVGRVCVRFSSGLEFCIWAVRTHQHDRSHNHHAAPYSRRNSHAVGRKAESCTHRPESSTGKTCTNRLAIKFAKLFHVPGGCLFPVSRRSPGEHTSLNDPVDGGASASTASSGRVGANKKRQDADPVPPHAALPHRNSASTIHPEQSIAVRYRNASVTRCIRGASDAKTANSAKIKTPPTHRPPTHACSCPHHDR